MTATALTANARQLPREVDRALLFSDVGYAPHPRQQLVHDSRARRRVVSCGVRWGKSLCAAMEGVASALEPCERSVGWVVAPTYQLSTRVFREIVHTFRTKLPHRIQEIREHDHYMLVANVAGGLCEIRGKSADAPNSLLGEGLDWLIIDEAARIAPHIWQRHLRQRLVDKEGWAMMISSPRGKGWFYDAWRAGRPGTRSDPDTESWNFPSWTNPLLTAEAIEFERKDLPDAVFRQEYGAEFMEGYGQVFRNVRDLATGEWHEPVRGETYYAGLDLAKVEDFTVLVIVNRARQVCYADRFHREDWSVQVERIKAATERYNNCLTLVDSTGVGDPVVEQLVKGGVRARGYQFTHASKSDLVNNLVMLLERRTFELPRAELWPDGIDELEAFEYSIKDDGKVTGTSAPGGMHDDCAVATMLAAWWVRRDPVKMSATWVQ